MRSHVIMMFSRTCCNRGGDNGIGVESSFGVPVAFHLVLVVKYRRKVFDDIVSARAREIFEYIAPKYGITVEEWNHDMDHVHVLFRAQPKSELSKFINAYKSASSRLLKQEFPQIRQKLWKEYFWSRSFCLLTTGGAPIEVVRRYIENQGRR